MTFCVCTVLQAISDDNFHVGFNRIYDVNLAKSLRNIFKRHAHLFRGLEAKYDLKMVENATSIREFDDAITRVTFGKARSHSSSSFEFRVLGANSGQTIKTSSMLSYSVEL